MTQSLNTAAFGSVFNTESWRPIFDPLGNEAGIDEICLYRATVPDGSGRLLPFLSVRSISDDEIDDLAALTQNHGDVIDEFSSYFWFTDRNSYAAAFRAARIIVKGGMIDARWVQHRALVDCLDIDGVTVAISASFSKHHLRAAV